MIYRTMSQEPRQSLIRWWTLHPWYGVLISYGLLAIAVLLVDTTLAVAGAFFVVAAGLWSTSLVQGLRVLRRKPKSIGKSWLIVLVLAGPLGILLMVMVWVTEVVEQRLNRPD